MITLFHQCGHNAIWNINSYQEDGCGSGLILSPIHQTRETIDKLDPSIRAQSIFDPQYYLPNSQKAKFKTYDFFPEVISNGFATTDFSLMALDSAKRCVDFQLEQEFQRLIIPARHYSDMVPDYTEKQDVYTVHPFLKAIDSSGYKGKVFLTLPVTRAMLMHERYRTDLLNWVTSYPRIDGVYLLVEDDRTSKQIQDFEYLKEYLTAIKELTDAGLLVTIGHCNTEGLLFTLIENCEITFGAYENTRIFSIDKFVVTDEERRGPRARIYLPGLFNWIRFSQAKQIRSDLTTVWDKIHFETDYADTVLSAAGEPHFNNPNLYKHFFLSYQEQVNRLSKLSQVDRYKAIRGWLQTADELYEEISDRPIDLDKHGKGEHIQPWLDAINWYYASFIK